MFAPHGWISLFEVYHWILDYMLEHKSIGDIEYTGDEPYEITWDFAEIATEVAVCLPDGGTLPIARRAVIRGDCDHENGFVNVHYGTIGSSEEFQNFGDGELERFKPLLGPFLHLPVIFPREDFDQYIEYLISGDIAEEQGSDESPKATAARILNEFRSEKSVTFAEIKSRVAPKQSVRQFRFAWQLAKEQEPLLAKPGRRTRKP